MNTTKYFRPRSGAARIFSWITAFVLVFSLLAFPARATSAPSGALSAELVFSSEGMDISGKLTHEKSAKQKICFALFMLIDTMRGYD